MDRSLALPRADRLAEAPQEVVGRTPVVFAVTPQAPRRLARLYAVVWLVLALGSVLAFVLQHVFDLPFALGVVPFFTLRREAALGTWVATMLHITCAVLGLAHAHVSRVRGDGFHRRWRLLAAVFALLSLDEVATLHEHMSAPIRALGDLPGFLHFAWVIPMIALGLAFLLAEVRLLVSLGRTGLGLALAGVAFVMGAAGLEMVESVLAVGGEIGTPSYDAMTIVEELIEFASVMTAACLLLGHLVRVLGAPTVTVQPGS